jgi:hypothetical protein
MDDHLGFILRHDGGNNYTLSVSTLGGDDVYQITKRLDGNNTAFLNASMGTRENTWYEVVARISEDEITAELYDENSTILKSVATRDNATSTSEFGILMSYAPHTVIAFKNLKVETLDQPTRPFEETRNPVNEPNLLVPYISLTIILAAAATTVAYAKKRKRTHSMNQSFSFKLAL